MCYIGRECIFTGTEHWVTSFSVRGAYHLWKPALASGAWFANSESKASPGTAPQRLFWAPAAETAPLLFQDSVQYVGTSMSCRSKICSRKSHQEIGQLMTTTSKPPAGRWQTHKIATLRAGSGVGFFYFPLSAEEGHMMGGCLATYRSTAPTLETEMPGCEAKTMFKEELPKLSGPVKTSFLIKSHHDSGNGRSILFTFTLYRFSRKLLLVNRKTPG